MSISLSHDLESLQPVLSLCLLPSGEGKYELGIASLETLHLSRDMIIEYHLLENLLIF